MRHAFLLVVYAFQGLALVGLLRTFAPARFRSARARGALWACAAGVVIVMTLIEVVARRFAPLDSPAWRLLLGTERVLALSTLFTGLVLVPVALVSAVISWVASLLSRRPKVAIDPGDITRREAVVRTAALGIYGGTLATAFVGNLHRFDSLAVTDLTLVIPDLPPSLEGLTVVQLTDLHIGVFTGRRELDHLVETVRGLRADVIVLTGDVMDNNPRHIPLGMQSLGRLRARLGVYGILGNHDHVAGGTLVAQGMRSVGIHPLVNARVQIAPGGGDPLVLAGVDDVTARRYGIGHGPDLVHALRGAPAGAPVLLLAHNPTYFDEVAGSVAAQLSGHTHGGQINLGGVAHIAMPYVSGRYDRLGSVLYVSRGIGITGPPVRLNAAPEVTRIGLTARRA